jgi:hypothetical protein
VLVMPLYFLLYLAFSAVSIQVLQSLCFIGCSFIGAWLFIRNMSQYGEIGHLSRWQRYKLLQSRKDELSSGEYMQRAQLEDEELRQVRRWKGSDPHVCDDCGYSTARDSDLQGDCSHDGNDRTLNREVEEIISAIGGGRAA